MMAVRALLIAAVLLIGAPGFAVAADVPYLTGRIVDDAELLSAPAQERVTALLREHETRTGNQIVVLTAPDLGGDSIEEFALRVFDTWKLGRKDRDNGVLLVIVPPQRKMRIEVGYGLEGNLTDVAASRILQNVVAPHFKAGEFDAGVEQGVNAIITHLEGRTGPAVAGEPPLPAPGNASKFSEPDLSLTERILIGAFIFGIIGLFTVIGVLTPGMGWFLYFFLIPFWAMFPIIVVGVDGALKLLVTYLAGFPIAKFLVSRQPWYKSARHDLKLKGQAQIGGFTLSSGGASRGSSWSSGGGSGSRGYSVGGGRSGGGGASASW